ncbi:MAG: glycosyltransferase family 4 protein [Verrucomicrobiota bacterium]|nr:glycosyltransferase family 4 protein [Verrucomicrobiota bacterium]
MSRLRVLMTADTLGGVWTYALELTRALPAIDFALATMGAPITSEQRAEASQLDNVTFFPSSYALEWMNDPWPEVDRAGAWLRQIASEFQPDLVHLNGYAHAALEWNVPVIVVAHSCVWSWWRAVKGTDAPAAYGEYQRRVTSGLRAADLVLAPTAAMLSALRSEYDFATGTRVVPNARDPRAFKPAAKQPFIFSAGRLWDEAKNLAALDVVAPRLRWPIEVAGEILHPNGEAQQPAHVRSLGRLTNAQLADRLSATSIYALPARYEPFGLSALEAGLSGCALVLGDIPSLREVWADAAIFVDPDNHDALSDALSDLIRNDEKRAEFAKRAERRAREFSPLRMAAGYRSAYAECLDRSKVAA